MRIPPWSSMVLIGAAACGGDLLGATPDAGSGDSMVTTEIDASSPHEASAADASPAQDGADADALAPVCGGSWSTVFESYAESNGSPPVFVFRRRGDFLDFFRNIATQFNFVDPTTGMVCTGVATCTYDPMTPRASPQDVHHSNALDEFIGPDGRSYVWTYYAPINVWFAADAARAPQVYQTIVDYNAGCLPNCPCDAG